jgi:hypothetical protein
VAVVDAERLAVILRFGGVGGGSAQEFANERRADTVDWRHHPLKVGDPQVETLAVVESIRLCLTIGPEGTWFWEVELRPIED